MSRTEDVSAVSRVLRDYAEGTRDSDVARLKSIFHPTAIMVGYLGADAEIGSPEPFFNDLATATVGPEYAWAITEISVIGATATATLVEDGLFGRSFVNRFHLIRSADGAWRITAKLFHHD